MLASYLKATKYVASLACLLVPAVWPNSTIHFPKQSCEVIRNHPGDCTLQSRRLHLTRCAPRHTPSAHSLDNTPRNDIEQMSAGRTCRDVSPYLVCPLALLQFRGEDEIRRGIPPPRWRHGQEALDTALGSLPSLKICKLELTRNSKTRRFLAGIVHPPGSLRQRQPGVASRLVSIWIQFLHRISTADQLSSLRRMSIGHALPDEEGFHLPNRCLSR